MLVPPGSGRLGYANATPFHRNSLLGAFLTENGVSIGMTNLNGGKSRGGVKGRVINLSEGDAGIRQTLELMKNLAIEGTQHGDIWELSRMLVGGDSPVDVHDTSGEAQRLLKYIQDHLRWTPDTGNAETVAAPWRTLQVRAGDCDDLSTLLASLGVSIGLETRFKAIAANEDFKKEFSHVYVQFKLDGEWVSAEPSIKEVPLGWESPTIYRTMYKNVWVA
jgi:hypothetical protein